MRETTILNRISKLIENINYKSIYIEINMQNNKWTLEKDNSRTIGFRTGETNEYKSKHK